MTTPAAAFNAPENPGITVFLDLDGVMADFDRHAKEQGKYKADGKLDWNALDYAWWSTMPACDGAAAFYDWARRKAVTKFLTAPVMDKDCFSGKAQWVQDFAARRGKFILTDLIICTDKHYIADTMCILVDDREKNIAAWEAAGGVGVHHDGDFAKTREKVEAAISRARTLSLLAAPPKAADKPKPAGGRKRTTSDSIKAIFAREAGREADWKRRSKKKDAGGRWVREFENTKTRMRVRVTEINGGTFSMQALGGPG